MAELDFLPFVEGKNLTATNLNVLVNAIADGSIFTSPSGISDALNTFGNQLAAMNIRVTNLENLSHYLPTREQFVLTANQPSITVTQMPIIDSESVNLNGVELTKDGIPLGFVGNYTLATRTITFSAAVRDTIQAGDVVIVRYWYQD